MRLFLFGFLAIGVSGFVISPGLAQKKGKFQDEAPRFGWKEDLPGAMKEAKKVGKPIMLVFRCVP